MSDREEILEIQQTNEKKLKQMSVYHKARYKHIFQLNGNVRDLYSRHIPYYMAFPRSLTPNTNFAFSIIIRGNKVFFAPMKRWEVNEDSGISFNAKDDDDYMNPIALQEQFTTITGFEFESKNKTSIQGKTNQFLKIIDYLITGEYSTWVDKTRTHPIQFGYPTLLIIDDKSVLTPYAYDLFRKWYYSNTTRSSMIILLDSDQQNRDYLFKVEMDWPTEKEIENWIDFLLTIHTDKTILEANKSLIAKIAFEKQLNLIQVEDLIVHPKFDGTKKVNMETGMIMKEIKFHVLML